MFMKGGADQNKHERTSIILTCSYSSFLVSLTLTPNLQPFILGKNLLSHCINYIYEILCNHKTWLLREKTRVGALKKTEKNKMDQTLYRKCLVILSMMMMIGTSMAAYAGTPWRQASATFYGDETASATMGKIQILLHDIVCKHKVEI